MKALIVTAYAGFVRSFLKNDIKILQNLGYEVHIAANKNHAGVGNIDEFFKEYDVEFHQIDFSSNKPFSKETLLSYKQFNSLMHELKFDFVHVHTPIPGVICRLACQKYRRKGMKVFYTTHGFYFHKGSSWKTRVIYSSVENVMSYFSDAIITINNEDFENAKKMHCAEVYKLPGVGVDTRKFRETKVNRDEYRHELGINENDILILAVGELSERKNHQIIIKAIAKSRLKNVVFMIFGNAMTDSDTTEKLKMLADNLGVNLRLMGLRTDIPQICKCADIGVMPSTREGLGLSGIEMIASGLPIVASNVHGIPDYVKPGINGYLASPYDEMDFANGIKELLSWDINEDRRYRIQHSVDRFDVQFSYVKVKEIYENLL